MAVLGACFSGEFLPTVSAPGRVIITSARATEASFKGPPEQDGRTGEYFVEALFNQLARNANWRQAFLAAGDTIRAYTRQPDLVGNAIQTALDGAAQHPLLEDNHDGVGHTNWTRFSRMRAGRTGHWRAP